jgi:FixJ family two-component response regulator
MTNRDPHVICVVDDDESVREAVCALLKSAGYAARTFESAELFLESAPMQTFGCLITDLSMPGVDGLELQRRLSREDGTLPIIFISAHDDASKRRRAMSAGAAGFFRKPFAGDALLAAIEAVIRAQKGKLPSRGVVTAPQELLRSCEYVGSSPESPAQLERGRKGAP